MAKSQAQVDADNAMIAEATRRKAAIDSIPSLYKTNLNRDATPTDIANWTKWIKDGRLGATQNFEDVFKAAATDEITNAVGTPGGLTQYGNSPLIQSDKVVNAQSSKLGNDLYSGNIPGLNLDAQTKDLESQYGQAQTELASKLSEQAAGGGFDTGGYYSSVAKGNAALESSKITTLAELNNSLTQYKISLASQGAGILQGLNDKTYNRATYAADMDAYNKSMADYQAALKNQQNDWWKPVVGAIAGSWLGPGGIIAGASAGNALKTPTPTQPTQPSYYSSVTNALQPVGFGLNPSIKGKDYFSQAY